MGEEQGSSVAESGGSPPAAAKSEGPCKSDAEHLRLALNGVKAALPVLYQCLDSEYNVDSWGLLGRIAALEAARDYRPPAENNVSSPSEASAGNPATDEPNTSTPPTQSEEP